MQTKTQSSADSKNVHLYRETITTIVVQLKLVRGSRKCNAKGNLLLVGVEDGKLQVMVVSQLVCVGDGTLRVKVMAKLEGEEM